MLIVRQIARNVNTLFSTLADEAAMDSNVILR